ncbi:hypothetical protein C8R44DRAFT_734931 [Mycena epipterygia]|nr:hypothetical protein C8R44DRAFT_734931 [Mycena epipterygia]
MRFFLQGSSVQLSFRFFQLYALLKYCQRDSTWVTVPAWKKTCIKTFGRRLPIGTYDVKLRFNLIDSSAKNFLSFFASMSTNTDRTHPCFRGDPLPASAQQPDLATEVRSFMLDRQPLDYQYDITPVPGKKARVLCYHVPFYQISGLGPPPDDLTGANPGDVYIDLTPNHFALYGKVADGSWKRWFDPQPGEKTDENSVKHPHFRSRKLWCSTANGVSWFVWGTVRRNQDRARERKLVSQSVFKDQEMRWREASVLIRSSLAELAKLEQQKLKEPSKAVAENSRRGRSATHSWSPPFETSPSPVLGKRKNRENEPDFDPEHHTSNLKKFIQHFEQENEELAAKNSALEQQLARRTEEDNTRASQHFNDWVGTVIRGTRSGHPDPRHHPHNSLSRPTYVELGPSGRKYVHLEAALAAMEDQLAQEESRCEDAQMALGRAVAEDEDCVRQFGVVTSQLGRTFGWA